MAFHDVVAALQAAGDDDVEALADAVARAEAAGLDGVPGEERQKLRGAGVAVAVRTVVEQPGSKPAIGLSLLALYWWVVAWGECNTQHESL